MRETHLGSGAELPRPVTDNVTEPQSQENQNAKYRIPREQTAPWETIKSLGRRLIVLVNRAFPRPDDGVKRKPGRPTGHCRLGPAHRRVLAALMKEHITHRSRAIHPGSGRLADLAGIRDPDYVYALLVDLITLSLVEVVELGGGFSRELGCGVAHLVAVTERGWLWLRGDETLSPSEVWHIPGYTDRKKTPVPLTCIDNLGVKDNQIGNPVEVSLRDYTPEAFAPLRTPEEGKRPLPVFHGDGRQDALKGQIAKAMPQGVSNVAHVLRQLTLDKAHLARRQKVDQPPWLAHVDQATIDAELAKDWEEQREIAKRWKFDPLTGDWLNRVPLPSQSG